MKLGQILIAISHDIDELIITNNGWSNIKDLNLYAKKSVILKRSDIPDSVKSYELEEINIKNGKLNLIVTT